MPMLSTDWESCMRRAEVCSKTLQKRYGSTGLPANTDRCRHKQLSVKSTNSVKASKLITRKQPHGIAKLWTRATPIAQRDWERCSFAVRESAGICRRRSNCGVGPRSREMHTRNSILPGGIRQVRAFRVTWSKRIAWMLSPEKHVK